MATAEFERALRVAASPQAAWDCLTDVALVASWVPIVEQLKEIVSLEHYSAVLRDQVGPFKLRADLDVRLEVEPMARVRMTASGEDRQVGSRIAVDVVLGLAADGQGSTVDVRGSYEVTGRIATLGSGTIRRKASKILEDFFACAEKALGPA